MPELTTPFYVPLFNALWKQRTILQRVGIVSGIIFVLGGSSVAIVISGHGQKSTALMTSVKREKFTATITCSGELRAKNSIDILGPSDAGRAGVYQLKINNLVPEGTRVKKGDFVADLDKAEIAKRIEDVKNELEKTEGSFTQALLDTTLTLSQARNELINLKFGMEEAKLKMEQSAFEAPSIKRQAELDYERQGRAYNQAQINYRTKTEQAVTRMKIEGAGLTQQRRNLQQFLDIMKSFTVVAPANGMVVYARSWGNQKKVVGSQIDTWRPIVATLPDLSVLESVTWVNEVDIQKVKVGQTVQIGLDAVSGKKLTGRIATMANMAEGSGQGVKVYEVHISVDSSDTTVLPGMTTSNTILVGTADHALTLPLEAIHSDSLCSYVYVKDGLRAVRQEVKLGLLNETSVVITGGLAEAAQVYLSELPNSGKLPLKRLAQAAGNPIGTNQ